jgi:nucleolar protein 14
MSNKKSTGDVSQNPFELRTNRRKHDVLGQKRKGEVGHRGHARDAAIQLRRRTLQVGPRAPTV